MWANDKALGRDHSSANTATMTDFGDCFRVNLFWVDGAEVSEIHDTREEALAHLKRLGFILHRTTDIQELTRERNALAAVLADIAQIDPDNTSSMAYVVAKAQAALSWLSNPETKGDSS